MSHCLSAAAIFHAPPQTYLQESSKQPHRAVPSCGVGRLCLGKPVFCPHPREEHSSFLGQLPSLLPATPQARVQIPGPCIRNSRKHTSAFPNSPCMPIYRGLRLIEHTPLSHGRARLGKCTAPHIFENLWPPQLFLAPSQRMLDRAGIHIPFANDLKPSLSKVTVQSTHYLGPSIRAGI